VTVMMMMMMMMMLTMVKIMVEDDVIIRDSMSTPMEEGVRHFIKLSSSIIFSPRLRLSLHYPFLCLSRVLPSRFQCIVPLYTVVFNLNRSLSAVSYGDL